MCYTAFLWLDHLSLYMRALSWYGKCNTKHLNMHLILFLHSDICSVYKNSDVFLEQMCYWSCIFDTALRCYPLCPLLKSQGDKQNKKHFQHRSSGDCKHWTQSFNAATALTYNLQDDDGVGITY